jgi:PAS domain S-box-containing protein
MDHLHVHPPSLDDAWRLLELATDGVWLWEAATDRTCWSDRLFRTLRYPAEAREPGTIIDLVHPDDRAAYRAATAALVEPGGPGSFSDSVRIRTFDGDYLHVESGGMRLESGGSPGLMLGYLRDRTPTIRQTEALRQGDDLLRRFMDHCPAAVFLEDADGAYLYANQAAADLAGVTVGDMPGVTTDRLVPPDLAHHTNRVDEEVRERRVARSDAGRAERGHGRSRWYHDVRFPVELPDGRVGVGGIGVDLTELRRSQQAAERAARIESIGRLAGGVAHDINNMLGVIQGYTQLAADQLPGDHPARADLDAVADAARRSAEVTRQLLGFAQRQVVRPTTLDLRERTLGLVGLLQRLVGERIELTVRCDPELWPVRLDPAQLDQLLTNLCVNARDAIQGAGRIEVTATNRALGADDLEPGCPPGHWVCLEVRDDGQGMDDETQRRVFEPFFTSKRFGAGPGLGLSTTYGIVKQNGGCIQVESTPEEGSVFRIHLPRTRGAAPKQTRAATSRTGMRSAGSRRSGTVLLVEDEPALLQLVRRMLEQLGFRVLDAARPAEALRIAAEADEPIHALLTDVLMPGMNGRELADRIREAHPSVRVFFMSGHSEDIVADRGTIPGAVRFLPKPFGLEQLSELMEAGLAEEAVEPAPDAPA